MRLNIPLASARNSNSSPVTGVTVDNKDFALSLLSGNKVQLISSNIISDTAVVECFFEVETHYPFSPPTPIILNVNISLLTANEVDKQYLLPSVCLIDNLGGIGVDVAPMAPVQLTPGTLNYQFALSSDGIGEEQRLLVKLAATLADTQGLAVVACINSVRFVR